MLRFSRTPAPSTTACGSMICSIVLEVFFIVLPPKSFAAQLLLFSAAGIDLLQIARPAGQVDEQLADQFFRRLVGQVAVAVEFGGGVADHDLRLIDREHIQKDKNLT